MSLSLADFTPLQIGSKQFDLHCDNCNRPSILNLRSRLAGNFVLLAFVASTVFLSLQIDRESLARAVVMVVGPLAGIAAGTLVSRLMPSLVASKAGT
jgi:hypothetical protein